MSENYEPNVELYLSYLRLVDPDAAKRFEKVLRDHEEDSHLADIAYIDLGEALRRMAVDLHQDKSAREHIKDAVEASPLDVFSSDVRLRVALEYLCRATDYDAFMASGQDPETFLDHRLFEDAAEQGEPGHLKGIGRLREAHKTAWAERESMT